MVCEIRIFKLFIPHSNSLKTKRRVVKSLVDRIRHRFNVSVIELSGNDVWQRADICVASLSNQYEMALKELTEIEKMIAFNSDALLTDVEKRSC